MSEFVTKWGDKPYHSLDYECKKRFGQKLYKIAFDGGMTCPNRDGSLGTKGCLFCSNEGSGDYSVRLVGNDGRIVVAEVDERIREATTLVADKMKNVEHPRYIAYFQAYSNTYAPISYLRELYESVLYREDIAVLSIATRPDCISNEVVELLSELNQEKPVWVELGLQSIHQQTQQEMQLCYTTQDFEKSFCVLSTAGIEVIAHLILGWPKETPEDMYNSVRYVADLQVPGVKLHLLHVLKGTQLAEQYEQKPFLLPTMEEYADIVTTAITLLPQETVIHRMTGDGSKEFLLAPLWSADKKRVRNTIERVFREQGRYQGKSITNKEI